MNPEENTIVSQQAPVKIGKFRASYMIVGQSWNVLKQDKELAWFPILSATASLVALVIMGIVFFVVVMGGSFDSLQNVKDSGIGLSGYVISIGFYLIMYFITNYFLAGIYTIVHARFNGQNFSFSDGISGANRNFNKIFMWSLISATVGVVLRMIADRFELVGKIIAAVLGAAWGILTYFSLPSLVVGQKSVKDSFKESASVIRKNWGETIIVNFGSGLFFGLVTFLGIALYVLLIIFIPTKFVLIPATILFVFFLVAITVISSTLGSIFKLALYEFAITGNVPQGFTPELVREAIKSGK